jgi:hypothetical protein
MTRLLQEAFTTVSATLSPDGQDRLAHLMLENVGLLEDALVAAGDEEVFEVSAVKALESDKVRGLMKKAAAKYGSTDGLATGSE